MREPTAEQFLKDVQRHAMNELHRDGVYRHLRFRQPENGNMWFELVTWPGHLTIAGDMGTWTFALPEIQSNAGPVCMVTFIDRDKVSKKRDFGRCYRRRITGSRHED